MSAPVFAGLDIETTGLLTPDHRIIEVYVGLWQNGKLVFQFEQRIDPQRGIAADAQRVHGISHSDLIGMPIFEHVAPTLVKILSKATHYVAHNGDEFDLPFLDQELKRVGSALPVRPSIDTMLQGTWATPDGRKPTLGKLCFACGVDYDSSKAHAASYDVQVMMDAFHRALDWGFINLPSNQAVLAA